MKDLADYLDKRLDRLEDKVDRVDQKVQFLVHKYWKLVGMATILSTAFVFFINVLMHIFLK